MADWYAPIRTALTQRADPCTIFFRDDDAGWNDARLAALLGRFAAHAVPIDLAVIPTALSRALIRDLLKRISIGDPVGLHQHGYAHLNHETTGRKCEFGPSRSLVAQHIDIKTGRAVLGDIFGPLADPIFTPPWNRCTADTVSCLEALGFRALSRDAGARPLAGTTLDELPVAVDWCKLRPPGSPPSALAERIAGQIASEPIVGIMLHHAVMDDADLLPLDELLPMLRTHARAHCVPMRALLPGAEPGGAGVSATSSPVSPGLISERTP
jgi:hypothetical protein